MQKTTVLEKLRKDRQMLGLSKTKIAIYAIIVVAFSALFVLWRTSANNYKIEKANREALEVQLKASQTEVENLKEYNKKIAKEMEKIEKEYKDRFQNIPKDSCGDAKPSQDLLEYLRKGE